MENTNDFEQIGVVGFMDHNGGFEFKKNSEVNYRFRTKVQDIHLNPDGITHGGFIMSLMDAGMGTAARWAVGKQTKAATISLNVKFISASKNGDLLVGSANVLKKDSSLIFIQGEIACGERLIASAEGIWKIF